MNITEVNIAMVGLVITFITVFVGWLVMFRKDRKERTKEKEKERKEREDEAIKLAYEKGKHDSEHKKFNTQIDAAHKKIRENGTAISDVKATLTGHTKVHESLLNGQKVQQDALIHIQDILMEK